MAGPVHRVSSSIRKLGKIITTPRRKSSYDINFYSFHSNHLHKPIYSDKKQDQLKTSQAILIYVLLSHKLSYFTLSFIV